MPVLSQEQKEILDKYSKEFQNWINSAQVKQTPDFIVSVLEAVIVYYIAKDMSSLSVWKINNDAYGSRY